MTPAVRLMIAKLNDLALLGKSYEEAASDIGGTYHYVAAYARKYGIPLRQLTRGRPRALPDDRSEDMRAQYVAGQTLEQIGEHYGVTRERVRQIITKHYGIRAKDGGKAETGRKNRLVFQKKRDARMMKSWGCAYKQYRAILKHPDQPTYAFSQQRKSADHRGIGWELNLWQWWKIWEQSGHWAERGRGRGYGMCRLNDTGPYAADNVYIGTGVENMQDYWVNKRAADAQVATCTQ